MEQKKLTITAQLYTVAQQIQTPEGIECAFARIHQDGYLAAQASGLGPIAAEQLRDIAQKYQVEICCTHSDFDRMQTDLDGLIREHRIYGCRNMGIGSMPQEYRGNLDGYHAFMKIVEPIAKRVADAGMHLTYHNHSFEFVKYEGRTLMNRMLEDVCKELHFILDTYWIQAGGADPAEYIRKADGRMEVCHLKDMAIVTDPANEMCGVSQHYAPIGCGNLDFKKILKACAETGVKYAAIEQDDCYGEDPFECLALSRKNTIALANGIVEVR